MADSAVANKSSAEDEEEKRKEEDETEAEEKAEALYQEFLEHPAFAKEIDPSKALSPAFEGLMALKYEEDDPHRCALNYKDEGNHYFGRRKYDVAIANYDRALELSVDDLKLNAILLTNRATCNFYLKNYRKCINDCRKATEANPEHLKAYLRATAAARAVGKTQEAREWTEAGLAAVPDDPQLLRARQENEEAEKQQRTERRRAKAQEWRQVKEGVYSLPDLLRARGLRFEEDAALARSLPADVRVVADGDGRLRWPLLLLYPEHGTSDLVRDVRDDTRLVDVLSRVFADDSPPPAWDPDRRYSAATAELFLEAAEGRVRLDPSATVAEAAAHPRCVIRAPALCLEVVSRASETFFSTWTAGL